MLHCKFQRPCQSLNMWSPGFIKHQLDNHYVEQNETTQWLQHTGWPRLFHNRTLGIIAATTRMTKSAWNGDYLLVDGTIWHSEVQLPWKPNYESYCVVSISWLIEPLTLAKTSYRSRCLLDTYWKDNFWPHEFKVVKCWERYVDVWKSFICYVFMVHHFQTHQQKDIYNLRLRSDQTIMIHHVLYLVTLLQR